MARMRKATSAKQWRRSAIAKKLTPKRVVQRSQRRRVFKASSIRGRRK